MSVEVERRGPITVIAIDRPEVRNAIDGPTAECLTKAFESFAQDADARVAILFGAHGTFCAGADLRSLSAGGGFQLSESAGPLGPTRMLLEKPMIAAVEGYAVAGGLEMALLCDLRVASSEARFGVLNRRWGVPLMDGGTVRLPRLVGQGRALDMILTGRLVGADEALSWGLVDRVVEAGATLDAAVTLAEEIASHPQISLRNDRLSVFEQWGMSHRDALVNEHHRGLRSLEAGEAITGAGRFTGGEGRHGLKA